MSKKVYYKIDEGGLLTSEIKLTIDSKCYTKTKYIDDVCVPSCIYSSYLIKIYELPYVLILCHSNVYLTTWKTFKAAREYLKGGEFIVKRFKISENEESYVFTNPETKVYELKIPILKGEYVNHSIYQLLPLEKKYRLLRNSGTCIHTIKAHSLANIFKSQRTTWAEVGKPRKLTSSELNNIIVARVKDGISDDGDKLKLVRFLCKKGKPQSFVLSKDCSLYPDGTSLELSSIKVITLQNGIGEYKYEIIAKPAVKSSTPLKTEFEHICKFKKPIKGSTSHLIKINITPNKFSDYVINEEPYEFQNILDYVYLFKVPEYPKVLLVTKTFLVRATTWDTVNEANEDLHKYTIYQHRVDMGGDGITYIISPYDVLDEYPYKVLTAKYVGANVTKESLLPKVHEKIGNRTFIDKVRLGGVNFDTVRELAGTNIFARSNKEREKLYTNLKHGRRILQTNDELDMYLYSFGKMHQAKLKCAFKHIKSTFFVPRHKTINIIDYGCGQGIASMCFKDYLESKRKEVSVESITLIEPSKKALKRATDLCLLFYPNTDIVQINKDFDSLNRSDLIQSQDCTLHLMSNITDLDYDISRFARLINGSLVGENWFVIVSPYFHHELDDQMDELVERLNAVEYYNITLDEDEFECYKCTCRISLLKCVKK